MNAKAATALRFTTQLLARVRAALLSWLALLVSPGLLSAVFLLLGCAMLIAGVYLLVGLAWALIAGALPVLLLGGVLLRGVIHGG